MVAPVNIRPVLVFLVMAAICAVTILILRRPRTVPLASSTVQERSRPVDISLKKARFSEIRAGRLVWELSAARVDYEKEGDKANLHDIRMVLQGRGAGGDVDVTADSGEYTSSNNTVRLKGNIRLVTQDGALFETASLLYTGEDGRFSTHDPVMFRQQRLQLTATGMDVGVEDQRARFHSLINASLRASQEQIK